MFSSIPAPAALRTATVLAAVCAAAVSGRSQNLIALDPPTGGFVEGVGVSPLYPGGGTALAVFPQVPPLPPPPLAPVPFGGTSHDGATGLLWATDGFLISASPHGAYAPTAPPIPPFPAPPIMGPLTGLAIDGVGGVLWITDGFLVAGVAAIPGGAPVFPPFPVMPPFVPGPLTGLDWDPITGSLWGVDLAGVAFNFLPGGPPAMPPVALPVPLPGPPVGIAIDKTSLAMPGAARSLYVLAGGVVFDYSTGAAFPTFGSGLETGLTYHAAPSPLPAGGPCPCPLYTMGQALRGPMTTANVSFGVDLTGLPPGQLVAFAFDFTGFNPVFPVVNGLGCPFGLNFASVVSLTRLADASGTASLPFSLATVPPGFRFYMQYVTPCAADPVLGLLVSPLYPVTVSAP